MKTGNLEVDRRIGQFKAACRKAGVKLTHQRLEIFREVAASPKHPDAETVFRGVERRIPTVSLDTVYRTLWLLNDLELVTTLGPRRERVRFDANLNPHHHYVCQRCGLVRDFDSLEFKALPVPDAVREYGSVVTTHVELRGLCVRCARKRAPHPAPRGRRQSRGKRRDR